MNLSLCLERFYVAAQCGNFKEAAAQVGVQTIAPNIEELESEYDVHLFERSSGGNRNADSLTEFGHVLYYIVERHESAKEAEAHKYLSSQC